MADLIDREELLKWIDRLSGCFHYTLGCGAVMTGIFCAITDHIRSMPTTKEQADA